MRLRWLECESAQTIRSTGSNLLIKLYLLHFPLFFFLNSEVIRSSYSIFLSLLASPYCDWNRIYDIMDEILRLCFFLYWLFFSYCPMYIFNDPLIFSPICFFGFVIYFYISSIFLSFPNTIFVIIKLPYSQFNHKYQLQLQSPIKCAINHPQPTHHPPNSNTLPIPQNSQQSPQNCPHSSTITQQSQTVRTEMRDPKYSHNNNNNQIIIIDSQVQPSGRMIKIKQNVLTLKGVTLRSALQIQNPDDNLAVIFELESPQDVSLCIQPKRGIIMQGEIKTIKVWVPPEDRDHVLGLNLAGKSLRINTTMKAEYNRKMMEKLKINGWQKIKNSYESFQIPIVISRQVQTLRSSLKQQANQYSSSMQRNEMSRQSREVPISEKVKNNNNQFKVGQSYSLSRPSRFNNKKVGDKLDKELDFLFKNQLSRVVDARTGDENVPGYLRFADGQDVDYGHQKRKLQFSQGQKVQYQKSPNIWSQPQTVTYQSTKTTPGYENPQIKQINNQRFLQVIMLAALAGFFAALGSNLKHLFI